MLQIVTRCRGTVWTTADYLPRLALDPRRRLWQGRVMTEIESLIQGATLPPVPMRRAIRLAAGVGQGELAAALGVSRWSIIRWETGKTEPQGESRRSYAGALSALQEVASV